MKSTHIRNAGAALLAFSLVALLAPNPAFSEEVGDECHKINNDKVGTITTDDSVIEVAARMKQSATWRITKDATPQSAVLSSGQSAEFSYSVNVQKIPGASEAYVEGKVCATNAGKFPIGGGCGLRASVDVKIKDAEQLVIQGAPVDVSGKPVLAPGETGCWPFRVDLAGSISSLSNGDKVKIESHVAILNRSGHVGEWKDNIGISQAYLQADVSGNSQVTVVDTFGPTQTFTDSGSMTYTKTFSCPADGGVQANTATIQETGQSANASVELFCQ